MESRSTVELIQLLQGFGQASDRYVESTGARYGAHRTDMNALAVILSYERSGTLPTPSDLSRELQLSSPATTALLDRLERLGYVQRQRTDKDRRVVRIGMTDLARADGRAMFLPLAQQMSQVISKYTPEQVDLLCLFMSEAIAGVDAAREAGADGAAPPNRAAR